MTAIGALEGRLALVTGAGQGIGAAIARALAGAGARVAVLDREEELALETVRAIGVAGGRAAPVVCDLTDDAQLAAAFERLGRELGAPDVLVNNVGWTPHRLFLESEPDLWARLIDLNFTSVLRCTRLVLPAMIERGYGRIVSIASDAARLGMPSEAVYAGAKAAVIGFSKSLAAEVARHGITVNVVSPGSIDTPMLRSLLTDEQIERRIRANPSGRLGRPEDVAEAVLSFACGSGYLNGQVLSVNGAAARPG